VSSALDHFLGGRSVTVALALAWLRLFGFREPEHVVVVGWFIGLPSALLAILLNWLYKVTSANQVVGGEAA